MWYHSLAWPPGLRLGTPVSWVHGIIPLAMPFRSRDGLHQGIFARPGLPSHKTHNHLRTTSIWAWRAQCILPSSSFPGHFVLFFCWAIYPIAFITSPGPIFKRPGDCPLRSLFKTRWFSSGPHSSSVSRSPQAICGRVISFIMPGDHRL
jgi:hypothetical protein